MTIGCERAYRASIGMLMTAQITLGRCVLYIASPNSNIATRLKQEGGKVQIELAGAEQQPR